MEISREFCLRLVGSRFFRRDFSPSDKVNRGRCLDLPFHAVGKALFAREEREREGGRDVAVEEELTDDRRRDNASPLRKATVVPACIVSPCCSRCFDPHTVPLRKRYAARLRRSNTDPALSRFSFPHSLPIISV